jgi:hypothetical protein
MTDSQKTAMIAMHTKAEAAFRRFAQTAKGKERARLLANAEQARELREKLERE